LGVGVGVERLGLGFRVGPFESDEVGPPSLPRSVGPRRRAAAPRSPGCAPLPGAPPTCQDPEIYGGKHQHAADIAHGWGGADGGEGRQAATGPAPFGGWGPCPHCAGCLLGLFLHCPNSRPGAGPVQPGPAPCSNSHHPLGRPPLTRRPNLIKNHSMRHLERQPLVDAAPGAQAQVVWGPRPRRGSRAG
jgi:hypothetical protein